jgi:hypothetical protein
MASTHLLELLTRAALVSVLVHTILQVYLLVVHNRALKNTRALLTCKLVSDDVAL